MIIILLTCKIFDHNSRSIDQQSPGYYAYGLGRKGHGPNDHMSEVRPNKVDSQFIVTIFPKFQVGGRSLFIIHWPFSFIKVGTPSIGGCGMHIAKVKGYMWTITVEIVTNLGCN